VSGKTSTKSIINRILYFFPFQLVLLHIKRNHLLLLFWFLLLGYTANFLATKYGVSYLFLYPEYLGSVDAVSFAITGFALGGFIMAFNIYTYIIHAHRFPFLATLSKPFYKFSINNFIIPLLFTVYYIYKSASFQFYSELEPVLIIITNLMAFVLGLMLFFILSFFYFFKTNKTIESFAAEMEDEKIKNPGPSLRSKENWYYNQAGKISWRVDSYLKNFYSMKLARNAKHYDIELLRKVFYQNHINATIFELGLIVTFLLIGIFSDVRIFILPGGASILLSFTFMLMVISVFLSWARGWTFTILLVLAIMLNQFSSSSFSFIPIKNELYGLNYDKEKSTYNEAVINHNDPLKKANDIANTEAILNAWKAKVSKGDSIKPKLIIVNCSGGGLRSALWTCESLAYGDSITNGNLLDHTVLYTGASGGMLGAAYVRELKYRADVRPWYQENEALENIGDDILNPLLIQLATFDLFSFLREFEYDGKTYAKDRAYSFESDFNQNTQGFLDKKLGDYTNVVAKAEMPMMILSPTVVGDGRRMLISSQPISYMTAYEEKGGDHFNNENIEFSSIFSAQEAMNTRFSSVLRANATFPYILPQVTLPTEPEIELMDAGIRDNYGFKSSFQYIFSLQDWLEENTSGVILLNVRDKSKQIYRRQQGSTSLFGRLLSPLGNLYNNFTKVHDFTHDQMFQDLQNCFDLHVQEIYLEMSAEKELTVSMSYHLTKKEKVIIKDAIHQEKNKKAFDQIKSLFE